MDNLRGKRKRISVLDCCCMSKRSSDAIDHLLSHYKVT